MQTKKLSKELVISTIKEMVRDGSIVGAPKRLTVRSIKSRIGYGSLATIQRHFSGWRKEAFVSMVNGSHIKQVRDSLQNTEQFDVDGLKSKNSMLSSEIIKSEKLNIELKEKNQLLAKELKETLENYNILKVKNESLDMILKEITLERSTIAENIANQRIEEIERLRKELSETNRRNLEEIKSMGSYSDDQIIIEKVKTVNLEEKLKSCESRISILEKSLEVEKSTSQKLREGLKSRLEENSPV